MPRFAEPQNEGSPQPVRLQLAYDLRFQKLCSAYLASGGMVTGEDMCCLMRRLSDQPISVVARWIVSREVVSVDVDGRTWLPLFQFDLRALEVTPSATDVIHELRGVLDDQELADWFAATNSWLDGASPADALSVNAGSVLQAARADRFVAAG